MRQIEPNSFICANSEEVLRDLPTDFCDIVLTDPPYGIGVSNAREIGYKGNNVFTPKQWDNKPPHANAFEEIRRISKNQIVWGGNYFALPASRCWLVWDKGEGFYNRTYAEAELAYTSYDRNVKIFKRDPLACRDYFLKSHPTQKPVPLFVWCILNFTQPGDLIIDPYSGCGTTALACHKTGRHFICIEQDREYHEIAQQRYADLIAQQELFGAEIKESCATSYNTPMQLSAFGTLPEEPATSA